MKTTFRYFISSILAFAMVFSTASFKLESHYCGDKLIDMAMFSSAESCE
ncbi:MAG: HYC_CC_PP family protein, partial [Flavobacteriales bacterium]